MSVQRSANDKQLITREAKVPHRDHNPNAARVFPVSGCQPPLASNPARRQQLLQLADDNFPLREGGVEE